MTMLFNLSALTAINSVMSFFSHTVVVPDTGTLCFFAIFVLEGSTETDVSSRFYICFGLS